MKFLNGWKTATGVAGLILATVAPHYVPIIGNADMVVQGAFGMLAMLGVIHKYEKARE